MLEPNAVEAQQPSPCRDDAFDAKPSKREGFPWYSLAIVVVAAAIGIGQELRIRNIDSTNEQLVDINLKMARSLQATREHVRHLDLSIRDLGERATVLEHRCGVK